MPQEDYNQLFLNYLQKNKVLNLEQIQLCLQETQTTSEALLKTLLKKNYCTHEQLKHYLKQFNQEHTTSLFPEFDLLEKYTDTKEDYIPTQVRDASTPTQIQEESSTIDPPSSNIIPKNRYLVLENIGEGGMGVVQKAKDRVLGREVALKKVNQISSLSSQFSQKNKLSLWRLSREAEITALLEHPNIIPLYDLQYNEQGELYFTMRKVEGETFSAILRRESESPGNLSIEQRLSIFFKVCDAVSYAHSKHIIHRDLKPDNIMVGKFGEVYVMDWGIAKKMEGAQKTSAVEDNKGIKEEVSQEKKTIVEIVNQIEEEVFQGKSEQIYVTIGGLGTPGYMAPEQHKNAAHATPQSDIYALGVILRQCFILLSPYEEVQLLYKTSNQPTKKITRKITKKIANKIIRKPTTSSKLTPVEEQKEALDALIPPDLRAIIQKSTNPAMEKRYGSVQDFIFDIECYQKNIRVSAREYSFLELASKWIRRNKLLFRSLFILLLLLGGVLLYLQIEQRRQREQQASEAYQKASIEELVAKKNEENTGIQIKSLLKAIHYLNIALSLKPREGYLEEKKYEIGDRLIRIACQTKDYNLADYVLTEIDSISFLKTEQKTQLKVYIKNEESRLVKERLERVQFWLQEMRRKPNWDTKKKALFEIAQMKEKEIFEALIAESKKAVPYFLKNSAKETGILFCYAFLQELLREMKNPDTTFFTLQQFQELGSALALIPQELQEEVQLDYLLDLLRTLTELKAKNSAKIVDEIRFQLGSKNKFYKDSEAYYQQLIFFSEMPPLPKTAEEFWVRGNIRQSNGDTSGAIEDWTQSIQLDSTFIKAYLSRGRAYGKEHPEKALEDYATVLQIDSENYQAYDLRANFKLDIGDLQGSVRDFQKVLEKKPDNGEAWRQMGIAKRFLRDYKGSIAAFDKVIQLAPNHPYAYALRGISKFESGDSQGALADYNKAILIKPTHGNAFSNRGVVNMSLGNYESAIFDFNHAIELNQFDTLNFSNRAECWARMKKYHNAIYDYNQALQIDPQNFSAFFALIECYKRVGKVTVALETYEKMIAIQPIPQAIQGMVNLISAYVPKAYAQGETTSLKRYILLFNQYANSFHLKHEELNKILKEIEASEKNQEKPK